MNLVEHAKSRMDTFLTSGPEGENAFRERAWAEFAEQGLPGRKTESWKYSTLRMLEKSEWAQAAADLPVPAEVIALREQWSGQFDIAVLINGQLRLDASRLPSNLPYELGVAALASGSELILDDGFLSLTAAVSRPGLRLNVPAGTRVERPLLIVRAQVGERSWASVYNQITLGRDSSLNIAELHLGSQDQYLRTEITTAQQQAGSTLNWVRVQNEDSSASHFADVQVHVDEKACLQLTQLNAGAAWTRSTLRADIHGQEAEAHIHGLSFGRLQQHIDQRVQVSHRAAHTNSSQLFKGVLKDNSRGVLNGKIYIARDAQKVSSSQLNHNLLLSPGAEADTKPELEIYADDVKANHGASIGRMDQDKLFYLVSRGIRPHEARQMLAHAFVGDVLMKIKVPELERFATERVTRSLPEFTAEMEPEL